MWTQDPGRKKTFARAIVGVAQCKVGGYNDWRLPIVKQGNSRYEDRQKMDVNGLATRLRLTMMLTVAEGQ